MWVLLVIQLTAASATARSSMPTLYSGVAFQEFSSKESCERARALISQTAAQVADNAAPDKIHNGVLSTSCLPK
jgi:uncharacterized protein involved in type VI secretion and phage assembly